MYQRLQLIEKVKELQTDVQDWLDILEGDELKSDATRFYKKGLKAPGRRVRQTLKVIRDLSQSWRMDLMKTMKQNAIFKGTEHEKDNRHAGHNTPPE
jgi:hypothetical protein